MGRFSGEYPDDWKALATEAKTAAGWVCVRCKHPHDPKAGYTLTTHHLDGQKNNCEWWNLAALCQRCHLHIQAKVVMQRVWMFDHSTWFKPYVAGYYAFHAGLPHDRESVINRLDEYLTLALTTNPPPKPPYEAPRLTRLFDHTQLTTPA